MLGDKEVKYVRYSQKKEVEGESMNKAKLFKIFINKLLHKAVKFYFFQLY